MVWPQVTLTFTLLCSCVQHCDTSAALLMHFARVWTCRTGGGTDRLFCLSLTTLGEGSWAVFDDSLSSSISLHHPKLFKALWRCHRYRTPTSAAPNGRERWRNGYSLVYDLVLSGVHEAFDPGSFHHNDEAGGRTTLETKIVKRGKHEICYHLLWCLKPTDRMLKELLTILF